jgi:periplasmic copper chaperone A
MSRTRRGIVAAALLLAACGGTPEPDGPDLTLSDVWARATASSPDAASEHAQHGADHGSGPTGTRTAVYLTIRNDGAEADRLLRGESPVAAAVEIHRTAIEDGIARMRPIDAVTIPARGTAQMRPGADHLMLLGLTQRLEIGDRVPLLLVFERAGELAVDAEVRAR